MNNLQVGAVYGRRRRRHPALRCGIFPRRLERLAEGEDDQGVQRGHHRRPHPRVEVHVQGESGERLRDQRAGGGVRSVRRRIWGREVFFSMNLRLFVLILTLLNILEL